MTISSPIGPSFIGTRIFVNSAPGASSPVPASGPVAISTRHGAARRSGSSSSGNGRRKPRRERTGAPTTRSSARCSAATRARSAPTRPGRVRTISRRKLTPLEPTTEAASSKRRLSSSRSASTCASSGSSRGMTSGATTTIRTPRAAASRDASASACSVSSSSRSGTTMLRYAIEPVQRATRRARRRTVLGSGIAILTGATGTARRRE